jgi:hypothetical protein
LCNDRTLIIVISRRTRIEAEVLRDVN